jgi:hypothetical protein
MASPKLVTGPVTTLLAGVEAPATGDAVVFQRPGNRVYAAKVVGDGAVAAEVKIWGAAGEAGPVLLGTITLSGTDSDADGFASDAPWPSVYAELVSVSGTDAAVTVTVGG